MSCRARGVKRACNKDKVQGGLRMPQAHKLELLMCFLSLTTYTALGKVKGITKVRLSQRTPQHTHTHTKAHTRTHTHTSPPISKPCPLRPLPDSWFLAHTGCVRHLSPLFPLHCYHFLPWFSVQGTGKLCFCLVIGELLICSFSSRPLPRQQGNQRRGSRERKRA